MVADLLDDFVLYRSLNPVHAELPRFADIAADLGLPLVPVPRKCDTTYGHVVARLLNAANRLRGSTEPIQRILLIGDTMFNDGHAFTSIARAGSWPGAAFIGCDDVASPTLSVEAVDEARNIIRSNRWSAIADFEAHCETLGLSIDDQTAVVFDLDKTLLGARGRNDQAIDNVRIAAARRTAQQLLGDDYDVPVFEAAYRTLNRPEFHEFTTDNQDIIVYLCLVVSAGALTRDQLGDWLRSHPSARFGRFLDWIDPRKESFPAPLQSEHERVIEAVANGDPTPLKAFRRNEFRETVSRLGGNGESDGRQPDLSTEIFLTEEVLEVGMTWRDRGALLFGLSDKPDEACLPGGGGADSTLPPLHRIAGRVLGM